MRMKLNLLWSSPVIDVMYRPRNTKLRTVAVFLELARKVGPALGTLIGFGFLVQVTPTIPMQLIAAAAESGEFY